MTNLTSAWLDFISQPFGAVGAFCIMAAVTALNSQQLAGRFAHRAVLMRVRRGSAQDPERIAWSAPQCPGGVGVIIARSVRQISPALQRGGS